MAMRPLPGSNMLMFPLVPGQRPAALSFLPYSATSSRSAAISI